jgi:hypothetical protein
MDKATPTTTPVDFALDGPSTTTSEGETNTPNVVIDEQDRQPTNDMAELLRLHYQYGHVSMRKIQEMATQGII